MKLVMLILGVLPKPFKWKFPLNKKVAYLIHRPQFLSSIFSQSCMHCSTHLNVVVKWTVYLPLILPACLIVSKVVRVTTAWEKANPKPSK